MSFLITSTLFLHADSLTQHGRCLVNLSDLKSSTLAEANARAIPVEHHGQRIGSLVPVGPWILDSPSLIHQISDWRARAMKMFMVQFESTPSKTETYLAKHSIGQRDRILFMIRTDGEFLGHVGLAGITNRTAELDNLMRGHSGGSPHLMEASEETLIRWAFTQLELDFLQLRVLSYNIFAKAIHERMGFRTTRRSHLRRVVGDEVTTLEECAKQSASVNFTCDHMTLARQDFLV